MEARLFFNDRKVIGVDVLGSGAGRRTVKTDLIVAGRQNAARQIQENHFARTRGRSSEAALTPHSLTLRCSDRRYIGLVFIGSPEVQLQADALGVRRESKAH